MATFRRLPTILKRFDAAGSARPRSKAARSPNSSLEEKFDRIWLSIGGPALAREVKLIPDRKFRFDRVSVESKVAIEIHGDVWGGRGRHVRGRGFSTDRFKMSAAQELGYVVYELTGDDITGPRLAHIAAFIRSRA